MVFGDKVVLTVKEQAKIGSCSSKEEEKRGTIGGLRFYVEAKKQIL